jgi:hypothetical protein
MPVVNSGLNGTGGEPFLFIFLVEPNNQNYFVGIDNLTE